MAKKGGPTPIQLKQVNITAKPFPRSDSTAVGNKMQSNRDIAVAEYSLNKNANTNVGSNPNLSGRNVTSDNINMMIAKRAQITNGAGSSSVAAATPSTDSN